MLRCKTVFRTSKRVYSTAVNDFVGRLHQRGIICDKTASFEKVLAEPNSHEKCGIYAGFDPTADGLHVGNLLVLQTLNRFRKEGGYKNIVALIGGGTGMIGDPSGKKTERSLLQQEQLALNISCLKKEIETFFADDSHVRVVNNADWLSSFNMIDWLRDVGKHFQVNNMMRLDSVKSRIGSETSAGMTFTEFSYSLLQSYDFYHLNKQLGVQIQIGGSDQWGNITSGMEFIRRKAHVEESSDHSVAGMTIPLLTTADGVKFGKSEGNAIWLNPKKTSPFEFYQYFMRTKDEDVSKFLRMLTLLPLEEIEQIEKQHAQTPEKWIGQRTIAQELVKQIHGNEMEKKVRECSEMLFKEDETANAELLRTMSKAEIQSLLRDAPTSIIPLDTLLSEPLPMLLKRANVFKSSSEARRAIQNGGLYINYRRESNLQYKLTTSDLIADQTLVLIRVGKKNYYLLQVQ